MNQLPHRLIAPHQHADRARRDARPRSSAISLGRVRACTSWLLLALRRPAARRTAPRSRPARSGRWCARRSRRARLSATSAKSASARVRRQAAENPIDHVDHHLARAAAGAERLFADAGQLARWRRRKFATRRPASDRSPASRRRPKRSCAGRRLATGARPAAAAPATGPATCLETRRPTDARSSRRAATRRFPHARRPSRRPAAAARRRNAGPPARCLIRRYCAGKSASSLNVASVWSTIWPTSTPRACSSSGW